jgi:Putative transposase of IS4/5 family (DUF4096)
MVGRGELTDAAWSVIAPLLPSSRGRRGGQWRDHRTVINGILWKVRTGAPRPVADLCGSALPLAPRRHLGPPAGARADQVGCGGRDRLGGEY